jgi:hypothetical protein
MLSSITSKTHRWWAFDGVRDAMKIWSGGTILERTSALTYLEPTDPQPMNPTVKWIFDGDVGIIAGLSKSRLTW